MENEEIRTAPGGASGSPGLKKHHITTLTVFFMIFCMVSAGAYGIEDMIPAAGPGLTTVSYTHLAKRRTAQSPPASWRTAAAFAGRKAALRKNAP